MSCQYDDIFASRYLKGELDTPSKTAFEHHIRLCPECQKRLESLPKQAPVSIEDKPAKREDISLDLIKKLRKPASPIPAKNAAPQPLLPPYMLFLKKYGIPILSALLLIIILAFPQIYNPIWKGLWSGIEIQSTPAISETGDPRPEALDFMRGTYVTDQAQLVDMLNEKGMGTSPWQVLYADEEKALIRNSYYVIGYSGEGLYLAADLDSMGLNRVEGSAATGLSVSPNGNYLLAGNPASEDESKPSGVYLFNTRTGMYAKVSSLGLNELAFTWSLDGRYLAFSRRNETTGIQIFDTQTQETYLLDANASYIKSIFINASGKLSVHTGNSVMSASIENPAWTKIPYGIEPFYIDPETGTVWFVSEGTIKGQIPGNEAIQSLDLAPHDADDATGYTITGSRVTGQFLVFMMKNGNAGALNLQAMTVKLYDLDKKVTSDSLPWHAITKEGTYLLFAQDGSLIISNGSKLTALDLPGLNSLSPDQVRWVDEENLLYVRLLNPNTPKAGELAIMRINVGTGESYALLKTGYEASLPETPTPVTPDAPKNEPQGSGVSDNTVYEKVKATGNWVESMAIEESDVKNGPSDRYRVTGQVSPGEILLYNDQKVSGFVLAKRVSGSQTPKEFWIPAKSVLTYNKNELPAGVIIDESVKLGSVTLAKGNLIRIIKADGSKSYCVVDTTDVSSGTTGWIDNSSYTKNTNGVYLTQGYLRSGSVLYMEASTSSQTVEGYADFTSADRFVNLTDQRQNGFIYVSAPGGRLSGWVREEDIFVPGQAGSSEPKGYDLDGDGIKDSISLTTDGYSYTLTVNNAAAGGFGEQIQGQYKVVDIVPGDSFMEIVIEEYGPSDDYASTFYRYNGENLILMGKIGGLCGNSKAVKGNGTVLGQSRGSILETWFYQDEYTVNSQSQLVRSPKAFYQKINYAQASPLKVKLTFLPFAESPNTNDLAFTLNRGDEVRFVGSDNVKWCLFETPDGRRGWLEISGFWDIAGTGITAGDAFEGLVLAD